MEAINTYVQRLCCGSFAARAMQVISCLCVQFYNTFMTGEPQQHSPCVEPLLREAIMLS